MIEELNTQLSEIHRINSYRDERKNQWVYFIHIRFYPFEMKAFTGTGSTPEEARTSALTKARADLVKRELLPPG